MNFDFSEDQKMLKEQARKFLSQQCTNKTVHDAMNSAADYDAVLWRQVCEMGWTGTAIPEQYGGLGLGYLELCVLAEEMGRALAPVPYSSTVYLFAEAMLVAGSEEQKTKLLPKVAAGELIGTFARAEKPGALRPDSIATTFKGGKLNGSKIAVADGSIADQVIVLASTGNASPGNASAENSLQLVLVDLKASGVEKHKCTTIDGSRGHATLTFKNVAAEPLGAPGQGWQLTSHILDRAAVLIAFEQVGGADACLEMAKEYSHKRYAFGRPIGSFQAIKHKLVDIYTLNELARSNAYYGAWALSTQAKELPLAAASARVSATQAFDYASKENIQTHGGIGFTWEADCHLFYKRSRELSLALGSARTWKAKVVRELEQAHAK